MSVEREFQFEVGETYSNRLTEYIVLSMAGGDLEVQYPDGSRDVLTEATQRRIVQNMRRELRLLTGSSEGIAEQFWRTMSFMAARADLQAEVPAQSLAGFREKYHQAKGRYPHQGQPGLYVLHDVEVNKWGPELRIYFSATPSEFDELHLGQYIYPRAGTRPDQYRINNNEFFYRLLALGFDLGPHQDRVAIRACVPRPMRAAFDESLVGTGQ